MALGTEVRSQIKKIRNTYVGASQTDIETATEKRLILAVSLNSVKGPDFDKRLEERWTEVMDEAVDAGEDWALSLIRARLSKVVPAALAKAERHGTDAAAMLVATEDVSLEEANKMLTDFEKLRNADNSFSDDEDVQPDDESDEDADERELASVSSF